MKTKTSHTPGPDESQETTEANARLIAAAPEMAELLERFISESDRPLSAIRQARALLAKIKVPR